ncbi:MAG: hypothetical protein ACJAV1_001898 [Paraglaciecola sp.]|jgi:hypothetical protein
MVVHSLGNTLFEEFVTISGKDKVLAVSDILNKNRLGNSRDNCVTRQVSYMDFEVSS